VPLALAPAWLSAMASGSGRPKPITTSPTTSPSASPSPSASASASAWVVEADLLGHPGAPVGQRRVTLLRLVGSAIASGMSPEAVWLLAEEWASRCQPAFAEWEKHVSGVLTKEARSREPHAPIPLTPSPVPTGAELINSGDAEGPSPEPDAEPGEREEDSCKAEANTLHPDAHHGLPGAILQALEGRTEAHPPSVLASLLTAFGNAIGPMPEWNHGMPHGGNMNIMLVGPTTARKGTAWAVGSWLIRQADPIWETRVYSEGFGSGEGLIWAVRDEAKSQRANPKTGQVEDQVTPGEADKRLLVVEEEMSKALRLSKSKESILSAIIRAAFDGKAIGKLNKGEGRYRCSQPHISIVGHITPTELMAELQGTTALANGFVNRFLIVDTRREVYISRNGNWQTALMPFVQPIGEALHRASGIGLMALDAEAGAVWDAEYRRLEERPDNVIGSATGRASDYVMKLSMLYALLDNADAIRLPHLRAGLALWRYCEASACRLFGGAVVVADSEPVADPLWLRLLNAIQGQPGVARSDLLRAVREPAAAVGDALSALASKGMAHCRQAQGPGAGRKSERWYPGCREPEPEGDKPHNLPLSLLPFPDAERRKELINSGDAEGPSPDADAEGPSPLPDAELINSFPTPEPNAGPGEKEKEVVTLMPTLTPTMPPAKAIRQWANRWNASGITRTVEPMGNRDMLVTRTPVGNAILGEAEYLPEPKPKPGAGGVDAEYVCRHSDLQWDAGKVIGTNLSTPELEWVMANPRKAEAIARRKSGIS